MTNGIEKIINGGMGRIQPMTLVHRAYRPRVHDRPKGHGGLSWSD
jgi:hypothetical protein